MPFKDAAFGALVGFALGGMYGIALGTNRTIELVSAAYGWPREEVVSQVKWYMNPFEEA